jgi:aminoglycoside 3-N-acetyltransferase
MNTETEAIHRLSADLLALGVRPGGVLLVHSSLSALSPVPGGAESVICGLLEALGPEGTLLMPSLSYAHVTAANPFFDLRRTPSNVGVIPETFRTRPGTQRSLHPTHSVCARGPLAGELLAGHGEDRTPCGPFSPFHLLPEYQGQLLMLGCGLRPNTSLHAIEELVEPPYLLGAPREYHLIDADGNASTATYLPHNFRGWQQRYDRVEQVLSAPALRRGPVLAGEAFLIEASELWRVTLGALRREPLYFVEVEKE